MKKEQDGRSVIEPFMEKPSPKLYPDYYSIIQDPIDMIGIKSCIENERYNNTDEIMKDFVVSALLLCRYLPLLSFTDHSAYKCLANVQQLSSI